MSEHQQDQLNLLRQKWLNDPLTKDLLGKLEEESKKQLSLATSLACGNGTERNVNKALIRAKAIEGIITYARLGKDNATNGD